jgi:hypothetical protein
MSRLLQQGHDFQINDISLIHGFVTKYLRGKLNKQTFVHKIQARERGDG